MDELVQWLGKQLDEDERMARAAGGRSEQEWAADLSGKDPAGMPSWPVAVRYVTDGRLRGAVANLPVMQERSEDRMAHIAAHDPARVLREINAKRQILRLHAITVEKADTTPFDPATGEPRPDEYDVTCSLCGWVSDDPASACLTLRLLALPYADRPGYHEEWRP